MMFLRSSARSTSACSFDSRTDSISPGRLFRQDVFCQTYPERLSLSRTQKAGVARILKKYYARRVGGIHGIVRLCGNNINSLNYRITSDNGKFLLKQLPSMNQRQRTVLNFHQRIAKTARKEKLLLPQSFLTSEGKLAALDSGNAWVLLEWMPGEHYFSGEKRFESIFKKVGSLSIFLKTFPVGSFPLSPYRFYEPSEIRSIRCYQRWIHSRKAFKRDHFEQLLHFVGEEILACFSEASMKRISDLFNHSCLTHIDLHPQNVLISNKGAVSFLDSASLMLSDRIPCVGYALFKFMRNHVATSPHKKNALNAIRFIRCAVTERFVLDRVFRRQEADLLALGARAMIFKRILYILRDYFLFKRRTWANFLPMHFNALKESAALFENARVSDAAPINGLMWCA